MEKRAEEIKTMMTETGLENTFWNIFDAYAQAVGSEAWNEAIQKLPAPLQTMAEESGLDSCLDWEYWGSPSFFGLTFEDKAAGEYFDEYEQEYIGFLNAVEAEMWRNVQNSEEYAAFSAAYESM